MKYISVFLKKKHVPTGGSHFEISRSVSNDTASKKKTCYVSLASDSICSIVANRSVGNRYKALGSNRLVERALRSCYQGH